LYWNRLVWVGRIAEHESVKPLVALTDKVEHTRRRRPWTRAFNTAALKGYEELITIRGLQLVDALGNQEGTVDLAKWVSFLTYVQFQIVRKALIP